MSTAAGCTFNTLANFFWPRRMQKLPANMPACVQGPVRKSMLTVRLNCSQYGVLTCSIAAADDFVNIMLREASTYGLQQHTASPIQATPCNSLMLLSSNKTRPAADWGTQTVEEVLKKQIISCRRACVPAPCTHSPEGSEAASRVLTADELTDQG